MGEWGVDGVSGEAKEGGVRRKLDLFDYLIRWTLGPFIAKWHRRRIEREVIATSSSNSYRQWRTLNPGRCMYCAYTRWANSEHGQSLRLEAHPCVEGNGPAMPLPKATVRS